MADPKETAERGASFEVIPIHFDVPLHYLPLDTFVETAEDIRNVIATLNEQMFEGELQIELVVLTPEEGGFIAKLGVVLAVLAYGAWEVVESDVGRAFVRGLTGKDPAYYSEQVGIRLSEYLMRHATEAPPEVTSLDPETIRRASRSAETDVINRIVVDSTKSFMSLDEQTLRDMGVTRQRF